MTANVGTFDRIARLIVGVTASDGDKRTFGPGDSVLMEDISGKGHRTRVKGPDECLAAIIPITAG